jgi:hypothetical protein
MADFRIETTGVVPEMEFGRESSIINNIMLSLAVRKGSWWHDPDFGLELPAR